MGKKQFCILPYLSFEKTFSIGPFKVWESNPENWKTYCGEDHTGFLDMYVDKDLIPLKRIPVVTCQSPISYGNWETFISVLFFLITGTNLAYPGLFSDNFYFEVWEFGNGNKGGYARLDKFMRRIISSEVREKILPSQFVNWNNNLRFDTNSTEFKFFEGEITKGFNSSLLRSLIFYKETQFRDPYLFPEEADVQNFCSAFQCVLGVLDRRNVGDLIADKLVSQLNLAEENREEIRRWMIDLYEVRSIYTHGDKVTDERLTYLSQRHIDIAKRVFQILIVKRCHGDGEKMYDEFLLRYFISNSVFRNVVKTLSKNQAKEKLLTCERKELLDFSKNLKDMFVNFVQNIIDFENKLKIRRALITLIYIFEDLYFKITDIDGSKYYLYPIKTIKDILDGYTKDGSTDNESVIKTLDAYGLGLDCKDPTDKTKEIAFRDVIPLSDLLNAFANLKDVYLDYHKL